MFINVLFCSNRMHDSFTESSLLSQHMYAVHTDVHYNTHFVSQQLLFLNPVSIQPRTPKISGVSQ